jgi:hypothetical protein
LPKNKEAKKSIKREPAIYKRGQARDTHCCES